jgi:hypothetical protein
MEVVMKPLLALVFALGVWSMVDPYSAGAACSTRDRIDLAQAGYTKADVESLCEPDAHAAEPPRVMEILAGEGQARWSQWCLTPQGSCPLNPALGYYAVDAPCNCYMPWGFSSGTAK